MILTKHLLEQVSWWETKEKKGKYDSITLHFKQWWKRSRTFKFPVIVTEIHNDWQRYRPSEEYRILLTQLINYFH